jgi:N-acetylmuramoyl-L-alanine amidase
MMRLNLVTKYMTKNDCYQAGREITPAGIMVHSTATPGVMAPRWFELWNKSYQAGETNRQVCVHAFVDDKMVLQTLPWDMRAMHAGGSANSTHIGFEMCEPSGFSYIGNNISGYDAEAQEPYFRAVFANAVELCAYLCRLYGLTPDSIISHSEGYARGIASNHADVMHWFPKHGESMDTFRAAVKTEVTKQEDQDMTQDAFNALMAVWQAENDPFYKTLDDVPSYWRDELRALVSAGAIKGDGINSLGIRRSELKAVIIGKRYADSLLGLPDEDIK